jgi:hypothetical protein
MRRRFARTPAYRRLRRTWPYVLIEVCVPGGTIVAALLWLSSGQAKGQLAEPQQVPNSPAAHERVIAEPPPRKVPAAASRNSDVELRNVLTHYYSAASLGSGATV